MHRNQQAAILLVSLISFQISDAHAQTNSAKYELGAGISSFVYQGDLTPSKLGSYKTMRLGINITGSRIINRSLMVRLNLAIGGLKGDESKYNTPEYRKQRNFNFRTPVFEIAPMLVWNLFGKNYADKGLSPYLLGGAGISILKIKRDWSNFNAAFFGDGSDIPGRIAIDAEHSLPGIIPVIPIGVGIRYSISPSISLTAESSYRLTFTDYLDGFSQAANPLQNDNYQTITIGAAYKLGNKNTLGCPVVKY